MFNLNKSFNYIFQIIDEITSLTSFSQYYSNLPVEQRVLFNNNVRSVQLRRGYQPFNYSDFTLKPSTLGTLEEDKKHIVKWHCSFSFFIAADCEINEYIYQVRIKFNIPYKIQLTITFLGKHWSC